MTHEETVLNTFYKAFQELDYLTMADCYHKDASFSDEVFKLKDKGIDAMWHMLCVRATDFSLSYRLIKQDQHYQVEWQANYLYSKTGRKVVNKITASFEFKDGKIYKHKDVFDFWRWSRQALGTPGLVLGWSHFFQKKVRIIANQNLDKFISKHAQYK